MQEDKIIKISENQADEMLFILKRFGLDEPAKLWAKSRWKQEGFIEESAVEKFKNYKCKGPCCNGKVSANDMSIIRTLGAEAILELQNKIKELQDKIDELS